MKRQGTDLRVVLDFVKQLPRNARIALGVLAVTAAVAAVALPMALSAVDDAERELRTLRARTSQVQGQARQAADDFDYVTANAPRYRDALARGVLDPQDRLAAKTDLDQLMKDAYLVRLGYEMAAAKTEEGPDGYAVVSTPMKLEVSALLDRDVFVLLRDLETAFPGYGVVRGFRITRADPVDDSNLKKVAAGTPVPFITGSISIDWRTARKPGGGEGGQQ